MQQGHFNMIHLMGQFHNHLQGIDWTISQISLHYATRGPTPSLSLSSSHPISLLSLSSSSSLFLQYSNPPHSSPSALLLFLPPHLSDSFQAHVKLDLPQIMLHNSSLRSCNNYRGEKGRMGCTLKIQITFVAVCTISNSWCTICDFQRASLCEISKLRTSSQQGLLGLATI